NRQSAMASQWDSVCFMLNLWISGLFKVQAVDCNFACLNPPYDLTQVRIFYLQGVRITDRVCRGIEMLLMSNRARRLREAAMM
ncbi:MAG TPA: hypothetical protein VF074_05815, partial [Pyrinomonadaceae bacterium]